MSAIWVACVACVTCALMDLSKAMGILPPFMFARGYEWIHLFPAAVYLWASFAIWRRE